MPDFEQSRDNKNVISFGDRIVMVFGPRNPNDDQFKSNKGVIFVEQPPGDDSEAVFWIKRANQNDTSWETWEKTVINTVALPVGVPTLVDTVKVADFTTYEYLMDVYDATAARRNSFKVVARVRGTHVDYTRFAILGKHINFDIIMASDGTDFTFNMQNNQTNSITVKYRRRAI